MIDWEKEYTHLVDLLQNWKSTLKNDQEKAFDRSMTRMLSKAERDHSYTAYLVYREVTRALVEILGSAPEKED